MENPGETLVGDYLRYVKGCDFVDYNVYTKHVQGEIDAQNRGQVIILAILDPHGFSHRCPEARESSSPVQCIMCWPGGTGGRPLCWVTTTGGCCCGLCEVVPQNGARVLLMK